MPPPHPGEPDADEQALLAALDRVLAGMLETKALVPRAPSVLPPLLALLRQPAPSRKALAERLTQDVGLAAEVLRLARSPLYYRAEPVDSLDAALALIGLDGLRLVMARTVLRPLYDAQGDGLLARAAPLAWTQSEGQAQAATALAVEHGLDRFDAYMLGLLAGIGRMALLRLLDREGLRPTWPMSQGQDAALSVRSRRLLGRLLATWGITPGLSQAAQVLASQHPAAVGTLPWLVEASELGTVPGRP